MPGLEAQVTYINSVLKAAQFASNKFTGTQWNSIADDVMTTGEEEGKSRKEPMIIDNHGECESMSFDDRWPMQVFHKIEDIKYSLSPIDVGVPGTIRTEVASMRMIVQASRERLGFRPEQLIAAFEAAFPIQFSSALSISFGNSATTIEMGTVEDDPYTVFNREWPGSNFEYFTSTLIFSISYKVTNTFNQKCFTLC